jgi:hypothetical protein
VTKHSPILGWVRDGHPVYGPYGYGSAMDAASGVRRMVSGYLLRDGTNGTDNLASTGRTTIPQWAVRAYGVSANQSGPPVNTTYPLGRYMEDKLYRGDIGQVQGVDFDLDEYNGRFCVTPEFPDGTYAYFVSIDASGAPYFPYNIGRAYHGSPTGSAQASITETVTTVFQGESVKQEVAHSTSVNPTSGDVTISWSSTEGGTYTVEATSSLSGTWSTLTTTHPAASGAAQTTYTEGGAALANSSRFYRVTRNALAAYDAVLTTGGGGGTTVNVPGGSAAQGTTITALITLPTSPPQPPANAVPTSITLAGTIAGTNISRPSQGTAQCTFVIPANAPTGPQNVVVVFNPAPTYTLTGGLTITAAAAPEAFVATGSTTNVTTGGTATTISSTAAVRAAKRKALRAAKLSMKKN